MSGGAHVAFVAPYSESMYQLGLKAGRRFRAIESRPDRVGFVEAHVILAN